MSGTKEGGKKAALTNKLRYGEDFYQKIGRQGGKWLGYKGFAMMPTEKVSAAGRLGGSRSKKK